MQKLKATLNRMYGRHAFGIKLGLEAVEELAEAMGNPHNAYASVHVAGTNGKGSVCAIIDSILRQSGITTGLFTSPHLVRFNERIRVAGVPVSDEELVEIIGELDPHCDAYAAKEGGREITFFEFTTILAFEHFRRRDVRIAVLETGMGGRFDATNIVSPVVSVVTTIDVEHVAHLGPDLRSIAGEKAGIIKEGVPVICGPMPEEAFTVVREVARAKGARLVAAVEAVNVSIVKGKPGGVRIESSSESYGTTTLPLAGAHQLGNCAMAVAAVETLAGELGIRLPPESVRAGVANVELQARFQRLADDPPVILDVAHNPQAAAALAEALGRSFPGQPVGLVCGICNDKDLRRFLAPFAALVKRCWAVPIDTPRGLPRGRIADAGRKLGWETSESDVTTAVAQAGDWAREEGGVVCIAGSFFLAGEVLAARENT